MTSQGSDMSLVTKLHRLKKKNPNLFRLGFKESKTSSDQRKPACRKAGQRIDPRDTLHRLNKKALFFRTRLSTKKGSDILSHKLQYHLRSRA